MAESTFSVSNLNANLGAVVKPEAIADAILESRMISPLKAYEGVPIIIEYEVTTGAATGLKIYDAVAPFKFRILDVIIEPRGSSTNGTIKLTNGTNDITNAITCATDKTMARAGTIDNLYSTISKNETLEVVCAGDAVASTIALITILAVKL